MNPLFDQLLVWLVIGGAITYLVVRAARKRASGKACGGDCCGTRQKIAEKRKT